jgi:hypothetical protein
MNSEASEVGEFPLALGEEGFVFPVDTKECKG